MTPRALLLGLLVCASVCYAQDATITTKSFVIPGRHGRPDVRCERTYRGKTCIMTVVSEKRASGEFVPYARSFELGYALVVESDEDRDGFFETLAISDDVSQNHLEVFTRDRDGTLHPISGEKLAKIKETNRLIVQFWKEALPTK